MNEFSANNIKYTRVSTSPSSKDICYMTDYYTISPDLIIYALLKTDHSFSIHQKRGVTLFVGKGIDERNAKKQIKEKLQEFGLK